DPSVDLTCTEQNELCLPGRNPNQLEVAASLQLLRPETAAFDAHLHPPHRFHRLHVRPGHLAENLKPEFQQRAGGGREQLPPRGGKRPRHSSRWLSVADDVSTALLGSVFNPGDASRRALARRIRI